MATSPRRRYAPRLPPEERREQLLDATLQLLQEGRWDVVSMEAVARAAGVTKPVVYDVFPNRGALLQALLEREEERAFADLSSAIPSLVGTLHDPDDLLVDGFRIFLEAVVRHPGAWRIILLGAAGGPEELREHIDAGRAAVLERLHQLVEWGVKARGGPERFDAELAAHVILATGEQAARLVLTDPEHWTPERISRAADGFMRSLRRR